MRQLITGMVIALGAIIFALQNADPVTIKLFFWDLTDISMALVLVITFIIGILSGFLFLIPGFYRRNKTIADQKKRIMNLEANPVKRSV